MGSGISGGPLTGGPAYNGVAPAGQSNILAGPLGAGATDVVTKIGSTVADAGVNAAAKLASFRTGIQGTETEATYILKDGTMIATAQSIGFGLFVNGRAGGFLFNSGASELGIMTSNAASGIFFNLGSGLSRCSAAFQAGTDVRSGGGSTFGVMTSTGQYNCSGTDSTGTPGAATIDKPSGKSAIAAGASSVTITCNAVTAASRLMVTFHARDATGLLPIAVPGAGSFTVTTSANCTAALPFSWEVNAIL